MLTLWAHNNNSNLFTISTKEGFVDSIFNHDTAFVNNIMSSIMLHIFWLRLHAFVVIIDRRNAYEDVQQHWEVRDVGSLD
ncbi:CLUMA_CG006092, isoform A [Clunio marinus]|uniref:CLUMA_CG006092, isoform A n=1 Tax=Clunio marinus TaxID=568069 RepID=A0A1J1HX07_9DIPT|nr:CLUMA_CG006092, isoform A [Clunio marinus]